VEKRVRKNCNALKSDNNLKGFTPFYYVEFISKSKIKICREISDLDSFTLDFLKILEKHSKYVVISGYVAILLGQLRNSILIKKK